MIVQAKPVLAGAATGPVLRLDGPLSFWGGVDPKAGRITDPTGSAAGRSVTGVVLIVPGTRGSSSSSAVLLELLYARLAPAAIILGEIDAIVGLGILVGRELGLPTIPLLLLSPQQQVKIPDSAIVRVEADGLVHIDV